MKKKNTLSLDRRSYSTYILIIGIAIIVPFIIGLSMLHYSQLSDDLNQNNLQLQKSTEASVGGMITVAEKGKEIYDISLDKILKTDLEKFLAAYDASGGKLSDKDLHTLKREFGSEYNLQIINESNVVIKTTIQGQKGFDYSNSKSLSDYLNTTRHGNSYRGDRTIPIGPDFSNVIKYGYMPAADHNNILQISYVVQETDPRNEINVSDYLQKIHVLNPGLNEIRYYNILSEPVDGSEYSYPGEERIVSQVIETKERYTYTDAENLTTTNYIFIDLYNQEFGADPSLVAAFEYDDSILKGKLEGLFISQISILLLMISLIIFLIFLVSFIVTRPVRDIVKDIDCIASGDLEHPIKTNTGGREFRQLSTSIGNMVATLNDVISKLRRSEKIVKEYNEELETIVEERTAELKSANEETNLYLDLMTHDINNANMAALGYAELMEYGTEECTTEYSGNVKTAIEQSDRIIRNVSTIRMIRDAKDALKPVHLSEIIEQTLSHMPDTNLEYEKTDITVLADELLSEVFVNLIGNAKKYAGEDCRIRITAESKGDEVRVCVEDNGPGMPDELKARCFDRTARGKDVKPSVSGKGLGLHIVKTLIEERYGGRVYAADRVPGRAEEGLKVCFTVQKA